MIKKFISISLTLFFVFSGSISFAKEKRGTLEKVINRVQLKSETGSNREKPHKWIDATVGDGLSPGDTIRTGWHSATEIKYDDGTVTRLGSRTVMTIDDRKVFLKRGYFWGKVDKNFTKGLKIFTASVVAAITGTEFFAEVGSEQNTLITVLEGSIEVTSNKGKFVVPAGSYITIDKNGNMQMPNVFDQKDVLERYQEVVKM